MVLKAAIAHAQERLRRAEDAYQALIVATTFPEAKAAWSAFVLAASAVYSKLETGSKGTKAEPWYGQCKHQRKKDQLLSYLHHARNTEEHGLEEISERDGYTYTVPNGTIFMVDIPETVEQLDAKRVVHAFSPDGGRIDSSVVTIQACLRLVRVFDARFGDSFDPPAEHLGQPLEDRSPFHVAELALRYLTNMVQQAGQRVSK